MLGSWLGLAQLGPFFSNSGGFLVLPREARRPHVQVMCLRRRHGPLSMCPGTSLHI